MFKSYKIPASHCQPHFIFLGKSMFHSVSPDLRDGSNIHNCLSRYKWKCYGWQSVLIGCTGILSENDIQGTSGFSNRLCLCMDLYFARVAKTNTKMAKAVPAIVSKM